MAATAVQPPYRPPERVRASTVVASTTWTFGRSVDGWTPGNVETTAAWARGAGRGGGGALALRAAGRSGSGPLGAGSPPVPAEAGLRYSATAWVEAAAASAPAGTALGIVTFRSRSGAVLAQLWGQGAHEAPGWWTQVTPVVGMAPRTTATVQFELAVFGAGRATIQYVNDAGVSATVAGAPAVLGPLSTHGNELLDGARHRLVLRGVQRFGLEGGAPGNPPPSDVEIGQLSSWGATIVRISLGDQFWVPGTCQYDPGYAAEVDAVVHSVTSRGMVALLDLHYVTDAPCGAPGLLPMADAAKAVPFWRSVAARYAHNPLVAFDLFNEPHDVPLGVWLHGGVVHFDGGTYRAAGMQDLYDAVRSTGARNLVVVSGMAWAQQPPTRPVAGFNVAYGVHAYTCSADPPPQCRTPDPYDPSPELDAWTGFAATHPVLVTEFGWPARDNGTYLRNVIGVAESHGWGWVAFAFDGSTGGQFSLLGGVARDGVTYEPSPAGMPVLAGLAANRAGTPVRRP